MKKILAILFILFISMQISACGKKQNAMPQAIVDTKEITEQQIVGNIQFIRKMGKHPLRHCWMAMVRLLSMLP